MRRLLTALPFVVLPLLALAARADDHEHGSLAPHEHGVAQLNVALDGSVLELELQSPAMNLVGFEHPASTAADQAKLAEVRQRLEQPLTLFELSAAAGCHVTAQTLESPLFGDAVAEGPDGDEHSDIHARYQLACSHPDALEQMSLARLFKTFAATRLVQVQLIAPNGQQGLDVSASHSTLTF